MIFHHIYGENVPTNNASNSHQIPMIPRVDPIRPWNQVWPDGKSSTQPRIPGVKRRHCAKISSVIFQGHPLRMGNRLREYVWISWGLDKALVIYNIIYMYIYVYIYIVNLYNLEKKAAFEVRNDL